MFIVLTAFSLNAASFDIYWENGIADISVDGYDDEVQWMKCENVSYDDLTKTVYNTSLELFCYNGRIYGLAFIYLDDSQGDVNSLVRFDFRYKNASASLIFVPQYEFLTSANENGLFVYGAYYSDTECYNVEFSLEVDKGEFKYYDLLNLDISFTDKYDDLDFYTSDYFNVTESLECYVGEKLIPETTTEKTASVKTTTLRNTTAKKTSANNNKTSGKSEAQSMSSDTYSMTDYSVRTFADTFSGSEAAIIVSIMGVFGILTEIISSINNIISKKLGNTNDDKPKNKFEDEYNRKRNDKDDRDLD